MLALPAHSSNIPSQVFDGVEDWTVVVTVLLNLGKSHIRYKTWDSSGEDRYWSNLYKFVIYGLNI